MHRKSLVLLLLVIGAGALLLATWLQGRSEPALPSPMVPPVAAATDDEQLRYPAGAPQLEMIRATVIPRGPVPLTEPLSARVGYDEDVTARVGVAVSGRIVAIHAGVGDRVRAGQVLAELDSPDVGTAAADLLKARADENHKRLSAERLKDLLAGEALAAKDWEAAQADYAQAQAETARAEQRMRNLNPRGLPVHGQRLALVAPLAGVISERSVTPAQELSPGAGAPLFVITEPRRLWLNIDLPERLHAKIRLGSAVAVESDAFPGQRFDAKISQLGQVVDPNTRRVVLRARLDNPEGKLLPEMFVRALILQAGESGVRVPNAALVNRGLNAYVFVEAAAGEFRRRRVQLLSQGGEYGVVGEGLSGGERIVTTGALLLDAELSARSGAQP